MSDRDDEVMLADPRAEEDFGSRMASAQEILVPNVHQQQMSARQVGDLFGTVTTAQPVIRERDHKRLMQTIKVLAETFGDDYVYSWRVKDKNSKEPDGKTAIEGPTINLTNDLAREYGNCVVEPREIEGPTHWVFYGRFTDLQTGYSLTRPFRQRKNALQGKYEDDRKLDMAYQMGVSKCLRNVVVNALRNYVDYMVRIAKGALLAKIAEDPAFYVERIQGGLAKYGITVQSAEALVGTALKEWTTRDIARVFSALKAVAEGLVDAKEAFPQDGPPVDAESESQDDKTSAASTARASSAEQTSSDKGSAGAKAAENEGPEAPLTSAAKAEPAAKKVDPKPAEEEKPKKAEPAKKPAAKKPAALF